MTQVSLEMNYENMVKEVKGLVNGAELKSNVHEVTFKKAIDSNEVSFTYNNDPIGIPRMVDPRNIKGLFVHFAKQQMMDSVKYNLNENPVYLSLDGKDPVIIEVAEQLPDIEIVRARNPITGRNESAGTLSEVLDELLKGMQGKLQFESVKSSRLFNKTEEKKEAPLKKQIPDSEKEIKTTQTLELKHEYLLEELDYLQPFASHDSEYFNVEFSMEEDGRIIYEINMDQVKIINPADTLQGFRELVKHTSSHPLNFDVNGEFGYLQIDEKEPVIIQTANYDYNNRGTIAYLRNGMDGALIKSGNLHEIKGELLDEMTTSMTVKKIQTAAPHNRINSSFDAKEFPIKVKDFLKENLGLRIPQIHQFSTAFLDKEVGRFAEINDGIMLVTKNEIGKGLPAQDKNATFLKIERDENMRPTSVKPVNDLSELIQSKPYKPQNKNYGTELYADLRERISVPSYRNVSMSQYQNLKGMMNPPKFSAFQNIDSTMNIVFDVKDTGKINEVTKPKHLNKELTKPRGR